MHLSTLSAVGVELARPRQISSRIFAIVMPTLSASSVTLIFRFADMTSMLRCLQSGD